MRNLWILAGALAASVAALPAGAQASHRLLDEERFEGRFEDSDPVGHDGGHVECFTFDAKANQSISPQLDTLLDNKMLVRLRLYEGNSCFGYALVLKPNLVTEVEGSSHFVYRITESGTYSILAAAPKGETGAYTIRIDIADNPYE